MLNTLELTENKLQLEIKHRKEIEEELAKKEAEIEHLKRRVSEMELINGSYGLKDLELTSTTARLASLIQNLDSAILVENENREILLVNQKFCDLFQIPFPPEAMIGMDCSNSAEQSKHLFKDQENFIQRIESLLAKKEKVLGDKLELFDDRQLKRDFIPVYIDEKYVGHLWSYEDITEISRIQNEIKSLSRFPKESPNPIIRCNFKGEILFANDAALPIINPQNKEQENENKFIFNQFISLKISQILESKEIIKEQINIGDNIYRILIVPIENKNYINIYATDITNIISAEQNIYLLKELLNEFDDFIHIVDKQGKFIFANKSYANLYNLSPEKLIGKNVKEFKSKFYKGMSWDEQFEFFKRIDKYVFETTHTTESNFSYPVEEAIKYSLSGSNEYIISFSKDITERKRAADVLNQQKEFYENILNNIPSDIAVFNTKNEYLFVNPAAIRDESLRKWIIGKTDFDYCKFRGKDEELAINRKKIHDTINITKQPLEWEDVLIDSNGNQIFHLRRFNPVIDENGEINILIGYGMNITEIKSIQEKLAKSEELYRLVLQATNDGFWDWNLNTDDLYMSPKLKSIIGYHEDELTNNISSWKAIMHPDDFEKSTQILTEHFEKEQNFEYTLRFIHKDQSVKWIKVRGFCIKDNEKKPVRIVGSFSDITDNRLAEAKLKESEEKLQTIFNDAHEAKFLIEPNTNLILDCNERAVKLFGVRNKAALIDTSSALLRKQTPTAEEMESIWQDFKNKGYWTSEMEFVNQKGDVFWGEIVSKIIVTNGKIVSLTSISDITERKKIDEELIKAKLLAEESTKAKEIFLANMSHEIRTPMNGILGMSELLSKSKLDSSQKNYLRLIKHSADTLLIIINDILDVAKINSGKLSLEEIPFNIEEIIGNVVQSLTYKAEEKGISLKISPIQVEHNIIIGDPFRLNQILINIINNAIKFTENGSVELRLRIPHENFNEITFEFEIIDTGIGIPKNKLETIFEGFAQASNDTTRKFGGTGLGLTICKSLIEMQGGNIWVDSELGKGSKFTFTITYKKGILNSINEEKKQEDMTYQKLNNLKILLAEDHEINQFFAKTILNEWGVEVDIANNGIEALQMIEKKDYDLVLMDILMPEMGGVEATQLIRENKNLKIANIPIIALTANALVGDANKYIGAGMNDYMSKPFESEKLYKKIIENIKLDTPESISGSNSINEISIMETNEENYLPDYSHLEKNFHNNKVFLKKILTIFIDSTPTMIDDLKLGLMQKDYPKIHATAHNLKTTIDSFKIKSLQEKIRKIEINAANQTNLEELPTLIQETLDRLLKVRNNVKEKLNEYES